MLSPKNQPVRLSAVVVAILQIGVVAGAFTISQQNITLAGQSLDVLVTVLTPPLMGLIQWLGARWTWWRVTPVARAEVLAETVEAVDRARQQGTPVQITLSARKEAARLLSKTEPGPRHATRPPV